MSVIFETLQKLKQSGDESPEAMPVSRRRRKTLSVGRAFFPLGIVLGIGVGLLVFFLWGALGMHRVPVQHVPKRAVASQDVERIQAPEEVPAKNDTALPPSPELKTVRATKGKLYLPASRPKQGREKKTARYLPPTSSGRSGAARAAEKQGFQYRAASENSGKAGRIRSETGDTSKGKAVPETFEHRKHLSESVKTGKEMRTALIAEGTKKPIHQRDLSQRKQMETTEVRTVDRSAQIGLLVARLQQAMRAGNGGEVKGLLERLENLKGKRSDYVMRLKAFWYLKEGKYDVARSFLQQLINKNENDLEAGINMAVLDIKTNHVEAARKRLRKMRKLHEENTVIPALLEKISR
ncbi:MAG: tetratricopeptide repeat protein [Deltaproteobacteria bacterium]|nr:tetratricopeptide repeat protein [Deltaproteobacteria bacterium]